MQGLFVVSAVHFAHYLTGLNNSWQDYLATGEPDIKPIKEVPGTSKHYAKFGVYNGRSWQPFHKRQCCQ